MFILKAIKFLFSIVKQFLTMKITVFDITYTPLELFIVVAVVGIICSVIRHFSVMIKGVSIC